MKKSLLSCVSLFVASSTVAFFTTNLSKQIPNILTVVSNDETIKDTQDGTLLLNLSDAKCDAKFPNFFKADIYIPEKDILIFMNFSRDFYFRTADLAGKFYKITSDFDGTNEIKVPQLEKNSSISIKLLNNITLESKPVFEIFENKTFIAMGVITSKQDILKTLKKRLNM